MDHINDCTFYSEMIFSYAKEIVYGEKGEGRKTPEKEDREAFLRHLEECDACREELSECVKMLREIEAEPMEVPEDLHSSIMSRVKTEAKVKRQKRYTKIIGSAAAVFVLTVGIAVAFGSGKFDAANDLAADGIFDFAMGGDNAPEADYNGAGKPTYDWVMDEAVKEECDNDGSKNDSTGNSAPTDVENGVVDMEAEEVPETELPSMEAPETKAPEVEEPESPESDAALDDGGVADVLEAFIKTTEFNGGVGYYIMGEDAGSVFDKVTGFSEWDSYSYGEYLILLVKPENMKKLDTELTSLTKEFKATLEVFGFGEGNGIAAVIIKW